MSTYRVLLTAVSVQSAKASYNYGGLPRIPIKTGASYMLVRGPVALPKNAVITSAKIFVNQFDSIGGGLTLSVRRNFTAWPKGVTWNTKPAVTDTTHTRALSSSYGLWWDIDVTADVQGFVSGTKVNYGWRISSNSSLDHKWRGSSSDLRQPYLLVSYVIPAKVPTSLSPAGGAVTVDKPVLTFSVGGDTLGVQVQVDAAADSVSPDFDTGEITATAGVVDLAATAYSGLADGSSTYWRARAKNSNGWSAWSAWVTFSRDDLDAVTITSPTATVADGTPPIVWSFAGTQVAYQATLLNALGVVLSDSGVVAGTDTDWTPARGLAANGDQGTARVRVWDNVTRIATPGSPAYSEDTQDFTVAFDGTVDPMDTLTASQVASSPGVVLTGTRAVGIPDEIIVFRNGVQVDRFPGPDAFTTATDFSWTDWTAPLGEAATYRLAPVVNGAVASGGPTDTITPAGRGLWLVDPETNTVATLWGTDSGTWDASDVATVHVPVADDQPVVRRRLRRGTMVGAISGVVVDAGGVDAADTLAALEAFRLQDAGTTYRLIAGHLNIEVIVGDIVIAPTPESSSTDVVANAQFNFWST